MPPVESASASDLTVEQYAGISGALADAASPDTRAAWEHAYQSYHAWLAANRRSAR